MRNSLTTSLRHPGVALRRPRGAPDVERNRCAGVGGLVRPAILLPAAVAEWTTSERRSVLAHELAHLARRDLWMRAIAQAACALHWYNPLVWRLASAAERAAESAADDLALETGIPPLTYAEALLSLVEQMTIGRPPAIGLAFARRSTLESRVRALIEPARERSAVTGRAHGTWLALGCLTAATIACVRLTPRLETARVFPSVPSVVQLPNIGSTVQAENIQSAVRVRTPSPPTDWVDDAAAGPSRSSTIPSPRFA